MMNYHELTMEEAKDSPAKKKQFLVISVIGIFCIVTGLVSAGLFAPVIITEGTFPGGEFMYKSKTKDYATSMALFRESSKLFKVDGLNRMWGDFLFGVFHDDPANVPGGSTRYSVGPIFDKAAKEKYQKLLLKRQSKFATWRTSNLPEVPAAISHFPWSNGFFASLIQQKLVLPKLLSYAKGKGVEYPVIVFTCSEQERMCTHYSPLANLEAFTLDKRSPEEYAAFLKEKAERNEQKGLEFATIVKGLKKILKMDGEL